MSTRPRDNHGRTRPGQLPLILVMGGVAAAMLTLLVAIYFSAPDPAQIAREQAESRRIAALQLALVQGVATMCRSRYPRSISRRHACVVDVLKAVHNACGKPETTMRPAIPAGEGDLWARLRREGV